MDRLGLWLRRWLEWGQPVGSALRLARAVLVPFWLISAADRDALGFRVVGDAGARAGWVSMVGADEEGSWES